MRERERTRQRESDPHLDTMDSICGSGSRPGPAFPAGPAGPGGPEARGGVESHAGAGRERRGGWTSKTPVCVCVCVCVAGMCACCMRKGIRV